MLAALTAADTGVGNVENVLACEAFRGGGEEV